MRKIISVLSLSCLSNVYAADLDLSQPQVAAAQHPVKVMNFEEIAHEYQKYLQDTDQSSKKQSRIMIINGVNNLMLRKELTSDQVTIAQKIATDLKAPSLLARLKTIGHENKNLGLVEISDLLQLIVDNVAEGRNLQDILSFLSVSKGFNKALLNAPVSLDLSPYSNKINDELIGILVTLFPKMKSLTLTGYGITDAGLSHLASLTQLQSLDLTGCYDITDAGLSHLASLTQLQSLSLMHCFLITDDGLAYLASLKRLQSLTLGRASFTNAGLAHLTSLTQLLSLDLSGFLNIEDAGLAHLASLKQLHSLKLSGDSITNAGLSHLASLTQLQSLGLRNCQNITNDGLAYLASLTQLQSLELNNGRHITDAGLAYLASLKQLRSLRLSWFQEITYDGIVHLASLAQLHTLNLHSCAKIGQVPIETLRTLFKQDVNVSYS